jgi:hypothetical protein
MASRGARLADLDRFQARIRRKAEDICRVEPFTIAAPEATFTSILPHITAIIQTLDINDNRTKVVVGSKALHHLLPNLIPRWTAPTREGSSGGPNPTFNLDRQRFSARA